MFKTNRKTDFKKLSLLELKDALYREDTLLLNRNVINKLSDKGESIIIFRDKLKEEINHRKNIQDIKESFGKLTITDPVQEDHVQKICDIEKNPKQKRFQPFCTLTKSFVHKPDSKVLQLIEDGYHVSNPTQQISLQQSLELLTKQEERVKEEQVKVRRKEMEVVEEYESDSEHSLTDIDDE